MSAPAATLSPLANGGSRIFWGSVSDKLGRESTMILSFLLQAVATAQAQFLQQFEADALKQYLKHLKAAEEKRIHIHGWVKDRQGLKKVS